MNAFWKPVFISVLSIELLAIGFYGYAVFRKKQIEKNVLRTVSVNPIKKENLVLSPDEGAKYFYEPKPNSVEIQKQDWLPSEAKNTINADTLNERYDYSVEKSEHVFRIMTLGDSFTYGMYVKTEDNWTELLEDLLNKNNTCPRITKYEVINLGMDGYDIPYIVHRFKTRGMKYSPDLIVWFESGSGFARFNEIEVPLGEKYKRLLTPEDLEKAKSDPKYYRVKVWEKTETEMHQLYSAHSLLAILSVSWKEFFLLKGTIPFVYILPPIADFFQEQSAKRWLNDQQNSYLYRMISDYYQDDHIFLDGHPDSEGHKLIAQDIYTYLTGNSHIPCGK